MEDLNNLAKKALYFAIGGAIVVVEETSKNLQNLGDAAQKLVDEMAAKGEIAYQEWSSQLETSEQPTEELRQRLFGLTKGNSELAERLLSQTRYNYPGKSERWYWEKVIYDLERDSN